MALFVSLGMCECVNGESLNDSNVCLSKLDRVDRKEADTSPANFPTLTDTPIINHGHPNVMSVL